MPQRLVPCLLTAVKRTTVDRIYGFWREAVKAWVVHFQKQGKFGSNGPDRPLDEFEVDESVFRKRETDDPEQAPAYNPQP